MIIWVKQIWCADLKLLQYTGVCKREKIQTSDGKKRKAMDSALLH